MIYWWMISIKTMRMAITMNILNKLITRHVSGSLKVAPEHTSDATLKVMRKPSFKYFINSKKNTMQLSEKHGLNQPLIPYFISSHPGCEEVDMANLSR
jgi:radical SAM superfamily enzyme YgiQ (UPF0313 family)